MNALVYELRGFSFSINIANFEAFLSVFKLTKNPLFLKSGIMYHEFLTRTKLDTYSDNLPTLKVTNCLVLNDFAFIINQKEGLIPRI